MPIVFVTYSLAFLVRANYGFASAAGIDRELGIGAQLSSLLGALFFLGYFFFQVPGALYVERRSARNVVAVSLVLLGVCATLTGLVDDIASLAALRFALGVVEAAVMPAMLILVSHWFTRNERSRANTLLILGNPVTVLWMSVVSAYLADTLGWRSMFVIEGLPAIAWAAFWWYAVPSSVAQARWLEPPQRQALQAALQAEQAAIAPVPNYARALRLPIVARLGAQYFCWSIGLYGFMLWLPSILKQGAALGMMATGCLSALPYLLAIVAMLAVSWASDRFGHRQRFVWPGLLVAALAFALSYALGDACFWASYALLVIAGAAMYAPFGPFFATIPELLPRNVAGGAMALINSMGSLGSFVGAYAVGYLNRATGSPTASYALMSAALLAAVILPLWMRPTAARVAQAPS